MKYTAYEKYKDSNIHWLGQIPANWDLKKLKFLGTAILGLTYSPEDIVQEDEGKLVLRSSNVQKGRIVYDDNVYVNTEVPAHLIVKKGDILICSRNGSRDLIGKNALISDTEKEQTFGAFMTIFRSKYGPFLRYVLDSNLFHSQLGRFLTSTINQLTVHTLNNFEIPFPPLNEQNAITAFLDKTVPEIDALIAKKEELLSKLSEKRTAMITHAVTKGLNPSSQMKDSGINWLGQIPSHWDVKKLKYLASCNDQALGDSTDPDMVINYVDISSVDLISGIKRTEELVYEKAPSRARRIVKDGDTIISTVRTYLKAIAPIKNPIENMIVSTGFAVIRPKDKLNPDFMSYCLQSEGFLGEVVSYSNGVSYPAINPTDLTSLAIPTPPYKEQETIVESLVKSTKEIDKATQIINSAVTRIKEYRSALITNAVTGKIKVA